MFHEWVFTNFNFMIGCCRAMSSNTCERFVFQKLNLHVPAKCKSLENIHVSIPISVFEHLSA